MPLEPRAEVTSLPPSVHGSAQPLELELLGLDPRQITDFSVCCNPFGPPPALKTAFSFSQIHTYPDSECVELRKVLSVRTGVGSQNIIAGNGATELLRLVTLAFVRVGDLAIVPSPTFGDYEIATGIMGGYVHRVPQKEDRHFRIDVPALAGIIAERKPRVVFLCNPNNPTGWYLGREDVEAIAGACDDTLVVLDEAYAGFTTDRWESASMLGRDNLLIVRSMTKDYAIAGLRLGYAIGPDYIISLLRRVCPSWNVNSVAQCAGILALQCGEAHLRESMARLSLATEELQTSLEGIGLRPVRSHASFFLMKVGNAATFRSRLLAEGVMVRDCTSMGLPEFVRIGVRSGEENALLLNAIRKVLNAASR